MFNGLSNESGKFSDHHPAGLVAAELLELVVSWSGESRDSAAMISNNSSTITISSNGLVLLHRPRLNHGRLSPEAVNEILWQFSQYLMDISNHLFHIIPRNGAWTTTLPFRKVF